MRFVPVKSEEQQANGVVFRATVGEAGSGKPELTTVLYDASGVMDPTRELPYRPAAEPRRRPDSSWSRCADPERRLGRLQRSSGQPRPDGSGRPRLCKNRSAGPLDARLIQTARRRRIKYSPRPSLRFYCCVLTTALSVFTQPGPLADLHGRREDRPSWVDSRPSLGHIRAGKMRRFRPFAGP